MEKKELPPGKCHDIYMKYFTSSFRTGYIMYKGCCLPDYYEIFADEIEHFEVRDDDIWLCTYPKSGTTWSSEMIWCVGNNCDLEKAKISLNSRFPFLEMSALFNYPNLKKTVPDLEITDPLLWNSVQFTREQPSPRYIKTHLPFDLLPKQIRTGKKKPKIIYISRNPKDVSISYYHHCKLLEGYTGSFKDFSELFLEDLSVFGPFWKHVLQFWDLKKERNLLFFTYEEMKEDLSSIIKKTVDFLETSLNENQIKTLLTHLSIPAMRVNTAVNYDQLIKLNKKYKLSKVEGQFIRSGTVNQWKESMTPELIQRFDKWTAKNLNGTDFLFNS